MKEWLTNLKKLKGPQALLLLLFLLVAGVMLLNGDGALQDVRTETEKRAEDVLCKIMGAGKVRVVLYTEAKTEEFGKTAEKPVGAVIVSEGAGDPVVRIRLLNAAKTLFALPANAIEVYEMEAEP